MTEKKKTPLEELKRAKEESYFEKKNREALDKLAPSPEVPSPVTGHTMKQETIENIEIARGETVGGARVDGRHVDKFVDKEAAKPNLLARLFRALTKTRT